LRRLVGHGRREVDPAVEPRLHRVLVGRGDVGEMARQQGPQVGGEHLFGERVPARSRLPTAQRP